jgi:hypothetical protein
MIRMSGMEYLPKDVREEFEKLDEEINFLENVRGDIKKFRRMFKFKKYD